MLHKVERESMNPTIPQNAVYRVFTVPWIFNDGTYGFKDMPCWVIETPRMDYAEYTEKGTEPMTLKEELTKLHKESDVAKKRSFIDKELPDRLREIAKKGYNCYTIAAAELEINHVGVSDMMQWCLDNGFKFYTENTLAGRYISIYWLVDQE